MPECPNCTSTPSFARQPRPESSGGKAGIIMVSIMSLALVLAGGLVAAGLYVVTLKGDSDAARFIETNILQVKQHNSLWLRQKDLQLFFVDAAEDRHADPCSPRGFGFELIVPHPHVYAMGYLPALHDLSLRSAVLL